MSKAIFQLANWPATKDVGQIFYIVLLVVFVALLAYYSTKLLASARGGRFGGAKRNLELLESIGVGTQSTVQIVRAGEKFWLIGVTKEQVTMLAELDREQLVMRETQALLPGGAFDNILKRFINRDKTEKDDGNE